MMNLGPAEPVAEPRVRTAEEQLRPFGVGDVEIIGNWAPQRGERPFLAVGGVTEEGAWEEDIVEFGEWGIS